MFNMLQATFLLEVSDILDVRCEYERIELRKLRFAKLEVRFRLPALLPAQSLLAQ